MKFPHREKFFQRTVRKLAIACACATSFSLGSLAIAEDTDVIFSKSTRFRIPFEFDAAELNRIGATEIQLFASKDQGKSWQQLDAVGTDQSSFEFHAKDEVEYWFSVRTVAAGGLTYPSGPHEPGLKVVVDTTSPRIDLKVQEAKPGEIELSWDIEDRHVDPSTLRFETRNPNTNTWEKLPIPIAPSGSHRWLAPGLSDLEIRALVSDKAGNSQSTLRKLQTFAATPVSEDPFSKTSTSPAQQKNPALAERSFSVVANEPVMKEVVPTPTPIEAEMPPPTVDREGESKSLNLGSNRVNPLSLPDWATLPETDSAPVPTQVTDRPEPERVPVESTRPSPIPQLRSQTSIATLKQPATPLPATIQRTRPAGSHLVNSTKFRIGYQLDGIGPLNEGSVELYITEDNGQKWFHYGSDLDQTSPFEVKVPRDGQYGFAFRIRTSGNLTTPPPQPGEQPEVVVVVDRTAPIARLTDIRRHPGQGDDQVSIHWQATDEELSSDSIHLYYSRQPSGPWKLIGQPKMASGSINWTPPQDNSDPFFVRLEVRDAAGNLTQVESSDQLDGLQLKPAAQISDTQTGASPALQ